MFIRSVAKCLAYWSEVVWIVRSLLLYNPAALGSQIRFNVLLTGMK